MKGDKMNRKIAMVSQKKGVNEVNKLGYNFLIFYCQIVTVQTYAGIVRAF